PQRALELANVRADPLRDEERDLLGQSLLLGGCLAHQDRDARLELRRLYSDGEPPAEARLQPFLEPRDFLRVAVARQHDLPMALEQCVESMEKLFLRSLLVREELDVVDQQRVERAIRALEVGDRVVLKTPDHIADET